MIGKHNLVNARTSFKFYLINKTDTKKVEEKVYIEIIYAFFKYMIEQVFIGKRIPIPCNLGSLQVVGKQRELKINEETGEIKGLPVDWKKTRELWDNCTECGQRQDKVYHLNEHTNGVTYSFKWNMKNISSSNGRLYSLSIAKDNRRRLASIIKNNQTEFYIQPKKEKYNG